MLRQKLIINIWLLHLVGFHSLDTLYIGLHASTPYSCPIVTKLESSSTDFRQITQIPNFIKIRPVGAELSHTDGQTDMTEANGRFPQRKRALKKTLYFRTEFKVKKKKSGDIQFYIHNILSDNSHGYFTDTVPRDDRHRHARRHSSTRWAWVHSFYRIVLQFILAWYPVYMKTALWMLSSGSQTRVMPDRHFVRCTYGFYN